MILVEEGDDTKVELLVGGKRALSPNSTQQDLTQQLNIQQHPLVTASGIYPSYNRRLTSACMMQT